MAKAGWAGKMHVNLRVVTIWLALGLVCLAGVFGILRFAEQERARDLRVWQDRLRIVVESRSVAVNDWVDSQYGVLQELANNAALQIYLMGLTGPKDAGANPSILNAQREYLYNLLVTTAARAGFGAEPLGADVAANVRRVGLTGLALLGPSNELLVATPDMPPLEGRFAEALARTPLGERGFLDLYRDPAGEPALGFIVPIFAVQGDRIASQQVGRVLGVREAGRPIAALLTQPGINEKSLESLLVRVEGATVEYLSHLRDGAAPLQKRLALDTPELADAALLGAPGGFVTGRDYRDVPVLATSRALAVLPWTLITKVDRAEALAGSEARRKRLVGGFLFGMTFLAVAFVAVWWHGSSRRAEAAAAKYRKLAERFERQKDFLRLVTDSQSDALYLVDSEHRYRFTNQMAARAAGITPEDTIGKTLASVLGPAAAQRLETLNCEALRSGKVVTAIHRQGKEGEEKGRRVFESIHVPLAGVGEMGGGVLIAEKDLTAIILATERHERTLRQLVAALVALVDRRDPYAAHHSERVAEVSRAIAGEMGLEAELVETAETAGKLMNLGKILVPEELLTRQGPLAESDKKLVQESLQASADLLEGIAFAGPVTATLRQLQEHWDGSGAPSGLAGEDILLTACIVAVANAFVAMVSPRAYRDGIGFDETIENLRRGEGTLFDRRVVVALVNHLENRGGRERWRSFAELSGLSG
ncbi:MAG: HD domain-containing phosphohydrolase [Pseudomonadota bacterium]